VSCILVGNKVDLCETAAPPSEVAPSSSLQPAGSQIKGSKSTKGAKGKARAVTYEEAEQYAKQEGLLFVEASAKSGVNVEQAFVDASVDILEKIKKGVFDDNRVRIGVDNHSHMRWLLTAVLVTRSQTFQTKYQSYYGRRWKYWE